MSMSSKKNQKVFTELAAKNVKKSARDYLIYFFTLMFSVCLFYTFNSIGAQFSMMGIADTQNFLPFAAGIILLVSVFICMIISGLIIYANRFLLKRRKKEIGIYITLGMEQKDILGLLMRETMIIGGISLITGLISGLFLSQGLALITAKIIGVELSNLHFFISVSAVIKSILFFAAVFALVHYFNTKELGKMKLIDLIYANRKNESLEIEGSTRKVLVFLASLLLIAGGYAWILTRLSVNMNQAIGAGTVLIIAGTILFFMSVADMILHILKKRKKFYYTGLNMFVLRQLASRMKSNVFSMSVISILMFASVTTMAVGLGGGKSIMESSRNSSPYDISFTEYAEGTEYNEADKDLSQFSLAGELEKRGLPTETLFKNMEELSLYYIDGIKGSLFLSGDSDGNSYLDRDTELVVVSAQDYNQAMRLIGKPEINLKSDEYALNYNVKEVQGIYEKFSKNPETITINGISLHMKRDGLYHNSYKTTNLQMDNGILIVSQELLEGLKPQYKVLNCTFANSGNIGFSEFMEHMLKLPDLPQWSAKEAVAVQIFSDTIIVSYIGIYLGIIFLITAGAVLALQQLTQSTDNTERYYLLRKLGTREEDMRKSVLLQLLIYFGIPIGIAAIHSAVIIRGFYSQFTNLSPIDVIGSLLFAFVVTGVIYSIYFITTCIGSYRLTLR